MINRTNTLVNEATSFSFEWTKGNSCRTIFMKNNRLPKGKTGRKADWRRVESGTENYVCRVCFAGCLHGTFDF